MKVDLVHRDGMWFLMATCEVPEEPQLEPVDWLGVDRGVVNVRNRARSAWVHGERDPAWRFEHHARPLRAETLT